jgi:hypothetical protein
LEEEQMTMNKRQMRNMPEVFDARPSLVFVVDEDVRIQEYKATASVYLMAEGMTVHNRRAGEIMHCRHSSEVEEGCGRSQFCKDCIIRNSVAEAFQGNLVVRRRTKIEFIPDANRIEIDAQITAYPVSFQNRPLVLLVIES